MADETTVDPFADQEFDDGLGGVSQEDFLGQKNAIIFTTVFSTDIYFISLSFSQTFTFFLIL